MNLLKAILVYMALMVTSSIQTTADSSLFADYTKPTETPAVVEVTPVPSQEEEPEATPSDEATPVLAPEFTPNPAYKTLTTGSSGKEVEKLQERLAELGYYPTTPDGRYGAQTRRAVGQFQRAHGLSADGIAGRITQTLLFEGDNLQFAEGYSAPTPTPTVVPELTIATVVPTAIITPEPTTPVSKVFAPETGSAMETAETSAPASTPVPTAEIVVKWEPLEGYTVKVGENTGKDDSPIQAYRLGEVIYLPLISMLEKDGSNILTDSSEDGEAFAFADGMDIVSVSYIVDSEGKADHFQVFRNGIAQIIQNRNVRLVDNVLYCPVSTIMEAVRTTVTVDEQAKQIQVIFQIGE